MEHKARFVRRLAGSDDSAAKTACSGDSATGETETRNDVPMRRASLREQASHGIAIGKTDRARGAGIPRLPRTHACQARCGTRFGNAATPAMKATLAPPP